MNIQAKDSGQSTPWNKGKLVGQKAPLRISEIRAIRVRLEIYGRVRDLALFNLAIDSKLRGCDLVQLRVNDVCHGGHVAARASVMQQKTKQPVQFELTEGTRRSLGDWNQWARWPGIPIPSRISESPHISTRQYARIVHQWFDEIGLDPTAYSTHTMRRTKPTLIYRRTKNLGLCSYCWATRGWRVPCDILALRSTTRSKWPSRLTLRDMGDGSRRPEAAGQPGSLSCPHCSFSSRSKMLPLGP
jgi:integrase